MRVLASHKSVRVLMKKYGGCCVEFLLEIVSVLLCMCVSVCVCVCVCVVKKTATKLDQLPPVAPYFIFSSPYSKFYTSPCLALQDHAFTTSIYLNNTPPPTPKSPTKPNLAVRKVSLPPMQTKTIVTPTKKVRVPTTRHPRRNAIFEITNGPCPLNARPGIQ